MKAMVDDSYLENDVVFKMPFTKNEINKLSVLGYDTLPESLRLYKASGEIISKEKRTTVTFDIKGSKVIGLTEQSSYIKYTLIYPHDKCEEIELKFKDFILLVNEYHN
jgi:hypothetical protein